MSGLCTNRVYPVLAHLQNHQLHFLGRDFVVAGVKPFISCLECLGVRSGIGAANSTRCYSGPHYSKSAELEVKKLFRMKDVSRSKMDFYSPSESKALA